MKRLIAAGILFVLVLAAYLTGHFYIKNTCDTAKELLNECISAYETQNEAGVQAENLKKYWAKKEKPLSFFVNHSEIDEIELAISTLKIYSVTESKELFSEYSGMVKTLLHQLVEDSVPNIHSIF